MKMFVICEDALNEQAIVIRAGKYSIYSYDILYLPPLIVMRSAAVKRALGSGCSRSTVRCSAIPYSHCTWQQRIHPSSIALTLFSQLHAHSDTMQLSAQRSASAATQRASRATVVPKCSMRVTPFVARSSQAQFSSACSTATAGRQLQVRLPCGIDSQVRPPQHARAAYDALIGCIVASLD
jgi:hypothetical protein